MKKVFSLFLITSLSSLLYGANIGSQADLSSPGFHNVSGIATIVDNNTVRIDHFNFDGGGIVVFIVLAVADTNASYYAPTRIVLTSDLFGPAIVDASVIYTLPVGKSTADYNGISVWCEEANVSFGNGAFSGNNCSNETVSYKVTFQSLWHSKDHDIVASAHFSGLVGGTHNRYASFWKPATYASPGIKSMAETGSQGLLIGEVNTQIGATNAFDTISGGGLSGTVTDGTGTYLYKNTNTTFSINSCYPLVTLTSMIAPSPDWFVGVYDYPLYKNGQWVNYAVVPLYPWDSGTDSGTGFTSANAPTIPVALILPIGNVPFASIGGNRVAPIGTFTFERIGRSRYAVAGDINNDGVVDQFDFAIEAENWLTDCTTQIFQNCITY